MKGQEFALDRELIRNLFDTAPVGMDEFAAMSALTDALVQERFKRIVIDPAPAGDGLRILELPAIAKAWLTATQAIIVKLYRLRERNLGFRRYHRALIEEKFKANLLLQIHDELLLETPPDEVETLKTLVKSKMEGALKLNVPLVVEVGVGGDWLTAK